MEGDPQLHDHFERGSALALALRGHPYDFIETYEILAGAYGYTSHAVNLGLWRAASVGTDEPLDPGQRLVRLLFERAVTCTPRDLVEVLDVGSGLGQGSVDLARWLPSGRVRGANINVRQLAFANALARARGVADRVQQQRVDACGGLVSAFGPLAFDAAFAVECIGHFAQPALFLSDLRAVLRPGGVFVCCMNVARGTLPASLRTVLKATYGFVPQSLDAWRSLAAAAGLAWVEAEDLTDAVLVDGIAHVRARLASASLKSAVPFAARALVRAQMEVAHAAVTRGALGYAAVVLRRPLDDRA